MSQDCYLQKTLSGGMTLLAERMSGVQSAAMMLLLPAGSATDPEDQQGVSAVLSDLVLRGEREIAMRGLRRAEGGAQTAELRRGSAAHVSECKRFNGY